MRVAPGIRLLVRAEEAVRRLGTPSTHGCRLTGLAGLDPDVARAVAAAEPLDTSRLPIPLMRAGYRLQTALWNRPERPPCASRTNCPPPTWSPASSTR